MSWNRVEPGSLPPEDVKVEVISQSGAEMTMFRKGGVWFFEDGKMYAYWIPAFWRELKEPTP